MISDLGLQISDLPLFYNHKSETQNPLVGLDGVEPSTSRLSGVRSNQAELQAPVILDLGLGILD